MHQLIYQPNTKKTTIVKGITDTSHIPIQNPDNPRHTSHPPIDLNVKIQNKKSTNNQTTLLDSFDNHKQPHNCQYQYSYLNARSPKARTEIIKIQHQIYDRLLNRPAQSHFVCEPHHQLGLRSKKFKKMSARSQT